MVLARHDRKRGPVYFGVSFFGSGLAGPRSSSRSSGGPSQFRNPRRRRQPGRSSPSGRGPGIIVMRGRFANCSSDFTIDWTELAYCSALMSPLLRASHSRNNKMSSRAPGSAAGPGPLPLPLPCRPFAGVGKTRVHTRLPVLVFFAIEIAPCPVTMWVPGSST